MGEEGSRGWSFLLAKHWGWETEGIVDNVRDLCCASPEGDETLCLQCLMGWRGSASSGAAATGGRDVPPPDAVVHSVRQNAAGECVASVRAMPAAAASALCWFGLRPEDCASAPFRCEGCSCKGEVLSGRVNLPITVSQQVNHAGRIS